MNYRHIALAALIGVIVGAGIIIALNRAGVTALQSRASIPPPPPPTGGLPQVIESSRKSFGEIIRFCREHPELCEE